MKLISCAATADRLRSQYQLDGSEAKTATDTSSAKAREESYERAHQTFRAAAKSDMPQSEIISRDPMLSNPDAAIDSEIMRLLSEASGGDPVAARRKLNEDFATCSPLLPADQRPPA